MSIMLTLKTCSVISGYVVDYGGPFGFSGRDVHCDQAAVAFLMRGNNSKN